MENKKTSKPKAEKAEKTNKEPKAAKPAKEAKAPKAAKAPKPKAERKTDGFGGRLGSRSSKINTVLLEGTIGSARQIAEASGEPVANVSAQLSWLHGKGLIVRKERDGEFIYKKASRPGGAKAATKTEESEETETATAE